MDAAERYIAGINARDADAVLGFVEGLRGAPGLAVECGRFAAAVLDGAPPFEGAGAGPAPAGGAAAVREVLGRHPAFASRRRLRVVAGVLGPREGDPLERALRGEAADVIVVGLHALREAGPLETPAVRDLVEVAVGADAFSRLVRDVILGGRPRGFDLRLDGLIPQRLIDVKELDRYACARAITGAAFGAALPSPGTSWATGITLLDPAVACPGDRVAIRGSGFGATRPADVDVIFPSRTGGCVTATVASWSDTAVEVTVPSGVGSGCVGFGRAGTPGDVAAALDLAGALEMCIGPAAFNASGRLRRLAGAAPAPPCPPCLPADRNRFAGGAPQIDAFAVNDAATLTVEPGTPLTLRWSVRNAQTIALVRSGSDGPPVAAPAPVPASGTLALGPFSGIRPVAATYRLTASNGCGVVTREVVVRLERTPSLSVMGIEVVQVIQRADNSVRLAAGKRTVARVFVDSGVNDGFDWGSGPNVVPGLTGTVLSYPAGRGFGGTATLIPTTSVARPAGAHNRNVAGDALMFELPLADTTAGQVRIEARIAAAGHEGDIGGPWKATASTTVTFEARPAQEVLPMLVTDTVHGLSAPSLAAFNTSLQEARKRYPLAETGWTVHPPIPLSTSWGGVNYDLASAWDWGRYLARVATMVFIFPSTPTGGVRAALVPRNGGTLTRADGTAIPGYAVNGMGSARVGGVAPAFMSQAVLTGTFAHELGHCYGLGHAPCPPPPGTPGTGDCSDPPDGIDGRLPGRTEDVGVDVPAGTVIPSARGELMSYCGDQSRCPGVTRWPSIAAWDLLWGTAPI